MNGTIVALLSGGIDSTVAMVQSIGDLAPEKVIALSLHYGSKHNDVEAFAADAIVEWYERELAGIEIVHRDIVLPNVFGGGQSALMGEQSMPHLTYEELATSVGPSPTVVPFRNANLISIATTVAITVGATDIICGMHAEDARGWAYPDCTPEFLGAMANAVYIGSYNKVRLRFPLVWDMKADVVTKGIKMEVPFHLTWSCYDPQIVNRLDENQTPFEEVVHCGKCPTCVERIAAFKANDVQDPVEYAIEIDWSGCDPL